MKLWGGRFTKETNQLVQNFNESLSFDRKFYRQDIRGSIAHVKMLAKQGILSEKDRDDIIRGLEGIRDDLNEDEYNYYECVLLEAESSLDIRHLCYELYKEHWLSENVTFEEKRQVLKEYYCLCQNGVSLDTYIEDQGYHGNLYVCYDEFLGSEYLMKDFVKELLDDEQLYDVYLKDMGNLISE